jgi:catalase
MSGPAKLARGAQPGAADAATVKMLGTQQMAAAMPFNASKPLEYQRAAAVKPAEGQHVDPPSRSVTGSTLSAHTGVCTFFNRGR